MLLKEMKVSKVELDELLDLRPKKQFREWSSLEDDGTWVWVAFDPEHKVVLAHVVGERKQPSANKLLKWVKERIARHTILLQRWAEVLHRRDTEVLRSHRLVPRNWPAWQAESASDGSG